MQMLVDNREKYNVPLVSDDYLATHARNQFRISAEITAEAKLKNVSVKKNKSQFFNTFTLQGTYTGTTQKGNMKIENNYTKRE